VKAWVRISLVERREGLYDLVMASHRTRRNSSTGNPAVSLMRRAKCFSRFRILSRGSTSRSSNLSKPTWSIAPYLAQTSAMIMRMGIILKPFGGGPMVPARVGPKHCTLEASACIIANFVVLPVGVLGHCNHISVHACNIGIWPGGTGLAAIVSVPPGEVVLFASYKSQS
jgi:hypothetical protein